MGIIKFLAGGGLLGYGTDKVLEKAVNKIYEAGKSDGKAEGYEDASNEYYEKLLKQANKFDKETNKLDNIKDEYEKLLDEYEKAINNLEKKSNRTELENEYLRMLLLKERELRNRIG